MLVKIEFTANGRRHHQVANVILDNLMIHIHQQKVTHWAYKVVHVVVVLLQQLAKTYINL